MAERGQQFVKTAGTHGQWRCDLDPDRNGALQQGADPRTRSSAIETYDRHAEKLREELTLARISRHSGQLEELDVEGILAFAERILPRASDLWVQASLDQRQRFQQRFFPDGIAFDGNRFIGTGVTAPAFSYLRGIETEMKVWWT